MKGRQGNEHQMKQCGTLGNLRQTFGCRWCAKSWCLVRSAYAGGCEAYLFAPPGCPPQGSPKNWCSSFKLGTRLFDLCGWGEDSMKRMQGEYAVTAPLLRICPVYLNLQPHLMIPVLARHSAMAFQSKRFACLSGAYPTILVHIVILVATWPGNNLPVACDWLHLGGPCSLLQRFNGPTASCEKTLPVSKSSLVVCTEYFPAIVSVAEG